MDSLSLYWVYCKTSMKAWFQYRLDAILRSFAVMLREATAIIIVFITFENFSYIGSWDMHQMMFLYSFMFITYGIFVVFFTGLRDFQRLVEYGELDRFLLRPRGVLFQVLASNSDWFACCGHLGLGILVMIYSARKVQVEWSFENIVALLCCIVSGVLIQGALFLVFASVSFVAIKTESLKDVIYWNLKKFMGYPISIYPKIIQYIVVYIVPLAFVNYFPAQLIMGRIDKDNIFPPIYCQLSIFVGCIAYMFSYYVWRICLKYYSSTGS